LFPSFIEYATDKAIVALNDLVTEIYLPDTEFTQFIEGLGKVDFVLQHTRIRYVNVSEFLSFSRLDEGSLYVNLNDVTFSLETDMRC
jgi:hypothetical protein